MGGFLEQLNIEWHGFSGSFSGSTLWRHVWRGAGPLDMRVGDTDDSTSASVVLTAYTR
jgi:hypothetical protein